MLSPSYRGPTKKILTLGCTTDYLIAPIPSHYKHHPNPEDRLSYEMEGAVFDEKELREKAANLTKSVSRLVSLSLLPASTAVMEKFSERYANEKVKGNDRRLRMKQQYRLGSIIGLAASSLVLPPDSWEEVHPDDVTLIAKNGAMGPETTFEEVYRDNDLVSQKIIRLMGEQTTADVTEKDPDHAAALAAATETGYYVAQSLARLSIRSIL